MLPIMVKPNTILKFEFVNLGISHLTGKKVKIDNNKLTAIQGNLLVDPTLHPMKTHSVHLPPFCWGRVEPPTKFSKRGAWQDLSF